MRKTGIILFVITGLMIFGNCTRSINRKQNEPADLIPRDTMVNIIVDLRLMDATLVVNQRNGESNNNNLKYFLNNSIMNKYNITRPQFDSSFYFYERDLKVLDGIYADAITKLTLMRGEPIEGTNEDYDEE